MKKISLLLSLFFIAYSPSFSQNAQSTEAERLTKQVTFLYRERKFAEAVSLAEKLVELERRSSDKNKLAEAILTLAFIEKEHFDILRKEDKDANSASNPERGRLGIKYIDTIEPLFKEAIDIYRNKLKDESLLLARAYVELASFLTRSDLIFPTIRYYKLNEVGEFYDKAISIRTKMLGEQNDTTLHTIYTAANFYRNNADVENALPLYRKYLELVERKYGKTSEFLLPALNETTSILIALNLNDESSQLIDKFKSISGKTPWVPDFDLTIRNVDEKIRKWEFDNPSMTYFTTAVTRQKWLMVHIEIDESGNVRTANAEDPYEKNKDGKDVRQKAEKDVRKLKFSPVLYQGVGKSVKGIIWYPYAIKL